MYVCVCVCVCVYVLQRFVCMYVCMYVCNVCMSVCLVYTGICMYSRYSNPELAWKQYNHMFLLVQTVFDRRLANIRSIHQHIVDAHGSYSHVTIGGRLHAEML